MPALSRSQCHRILVIPRRTLASKMSESKILQEITSRLKEAAELRTKGQVRYTKIALASCSLIIPDQLEVFDNLINFLVFLLVFACFSYSFKVH